MLGAVALFFAGWFALALVALFGNPGVVPRTTVVDTFTKKLALTVSIAVDGEPLTRTGVIAIELEHTFNPADGTHSVRANTTFGNGVLLPLPDDTLIVALLRNHREGGRHRMGRSFFAACDLQPPRSSDESTVAAWMQSVRVFSGTCEIEGDERPVLLYFSDRSGPESATYIDLSKPFLAGGHTITFISATFGTSDGNLNDDVAVALPWTVKAPDRGLKLIDLKPGRQPPRQFSLTKELLLGDKK